jgi:hypothetical protein
VYNFDAKLSVKLLRDFHHCGYVFGVVIGVASVTNYARRRAIRCSDTEETWIPQGLFAGVLFGVNESMIQQSRHISFGVETLKTFWVLDRQFWTSSWNILGMELIKVFLLLL